MDSNLLALGRLIGGVDPHRAAAQGADYPRLLQSLLDTIEVVVFVIDSGAAFRYVGAAWSRLTGFAVGETIGTGMLRYVHPQDHSELLCYLERCQGSEGGAEGVVVRCLTRSEECLRMELRAQPVTDSAGRRLGFVGTLSDVTLRTRAEGVKQASHRTLETLINALPGMVYRGRNNPQWTMEFVSEGCLTLTGYPPDAFINNRQVTFADLIVPQDRQLVWDDVQTALREDRPFELTYRICTAQGQEKWVLERGRGIYATSGELLGLEGFITDITAEKRAELRQARDSLYELDSDLPTRALFLDRLTQTLARRRPNSNAINAGCAVLMVTLDRFAKLRAQFGADFADRIATEAGGRFKALLGPVDSLCRWHEDQFAILLEQPEQGTALARQLQESLRIPIVDREMELLLTASIGMVLSEAGYDRAEDILRDAAAAMAHARDLGGARFELHAGADPARLAAHS